MTDRATNSSQTSDETNRGSALSTTPTQRALTGGTTSVPTTPQEVTQAAPSRGRHTSTASSTLSPLGVTSPRERGGNPFESGSRFSRHTSTVFNESEGGLSIQDTDGLDYQTYAAATASSLTRGSSFKGKSSAEKKQSGSGLGKSAKTGGTAGPATMSRGSSAQRPAIKSRSASRARRLSDDEEDEDSDDIERRKGTEKVMSPAPVLFGSAQEQDDEVERRDRGEELVRRRMKDRAKAKKEQERLRKQREASAASTTRRASYNPSPANAEPAAEGSSSLGSALRPPITRGQSSSRSVSATPRSPPPRPSSILRSRNVSQASTTRSYADHQPSASVYSSEGETGSGTPTPGSPQRRVTSIRHVTSSIHGHSETGEEMDGDMFRDRQDRDEKAVSVADEAANEEPEAPASDSGLHFDEDDLRRAEMETVDGSDDESIEGSEVEYTLKDRQDAINVEHPFGLPIWKPALYKKDRSITRNAETALHATPSTTALHHLAPGNVIWTILFGMWLALICVLVAAVLWLVPWGGRKYGRVIWELGGYLFWPFGKYVEGAFEEVDEEDDHDGKQFDHGELHAQDPRGRERSPSSEQAGLLQHGQGSTTAYGATNDGDTSSSDRTVAGSDRARRESSPRKNLHLMQTSSHSSLRVRALGRVMYWATFYLVIAPLMLLVCIVCWGLVFTIPMAKLLWVLLTYLSDEPLSLHFRTPPDFSTPNSPERKPNDSQATDDETRTEDDEADEASPFTPVDARFPLRAGQRAPRHTRQDVASAKRHGRLIGPNGKILLCTYRAAGFQYYKYTIDGVNIMFINLLGVVVFVILDFFLLAPYVKRHGVHGLFGSLASEGFMFSCALLSIIPLSYFIGMAVASISAQSSIGMGAVINASFGSMIEIVLYGAGLMEGKGNLVEGSVVGSILAGVLLMPGVSMIGGAMRRKEQKFNARSAGVTSTMLIMAVIGILTPTMFYEIYGSFELSCTGCEPDHDGVSTCSTCYYRHVDPADDPFYQNVVKKLATWCAILLVFSYLLGLWFSLRTHASQIWQNAGHRIEEGHQHDASGASKKEEADAQGGGHDAPNWSRFKSASVLLICTALYAVVAEILIDAVDAVLQGAAISEKLLGITLFALAPACTEFFNAVSFALNGNVALSLEIGSAYVLQACLIQVPAALAFSAIYGIGKSSHVGEYFTLVFPRWDSVAIIFSVFLLTYVYIEARANYYRGSILVVAYLVLLGGFVYAPGDRDTSDDPELQGLAVQAVWHELSLRQRAQAWLSRMM
ncbi:hypothetical protein OIV83_005391 [Microbotryomycetes sp. JL201]|nr:hypothetical protein OIV83_005391 [Microbotryomycetes sp. JL201]